MSAVERASSIDYNKNLRYRSCMWQYITFNMYLILLRILLFRFSYIVALGC